MEGFLSHSLRLFAVLLVGDFFKPFAAVAVPQFHDRDVSHCCIRRRSVPVLDSRRNPNDVALLDLLNRSSPLLNPARACRHDQDLTEHMLMPGSPSSGLERHAPAEHVRRIAHREERLNLYGTSEALSGTLVCLSRAAARDLDG